MLLYYFSMHILQLKSLYRSSNHNIPPFFLLAPRLALAAMDGSRIREEIEWSNDLTPELKNSKFFFVHTVSPTYYTDVYIAFLVYYAYN